MTTDREYLGKGWRFPVAINLTGGVSASAYEENIRESVFIILGTAPGERIKRPDFGCDIHELMFAPNNATTAALACHYVEEALLKWEPRIEVLEVDAQSSPHEPNRLDIRVTYLVVDTNDERNLVYPFYLRKPDEEPGAGDRGAP
jgi:phage baseplate assembly protein W